MGHTIRGLSEIADRYDALLCDVWGVIHNGRESFPAACEALAAFARTRGPVVLISNAPRPSLDVVPQLRALGVPDAAWSGFVSSGDATRAELLARSPGRAWWIGPERERVLFDGVDLAFTGPAEADFVAVTGLVDDETEMPEDYRGELAVAADRGLVMVCANPDRVVQRGDRLAPCGGALADLYETLGGQVVMAGKPYPPIYAMTLAEADRLAGRLLDRARVLCVGDGLLTDAFGANRAGLPLLFCASGVHAAEVAAFPGGAAAFLSAAGAHADHLIDELVW